MLSEAIIILLLFFSKQPCKSLSNQLKSEQNSNLVVKIYASQVVIGVIAIFFFKTVANH